MLISMHICSDALTRCNRLYDQGLIGQMALSFDSRDVFARNARACSGFMLTHKNEVQDSWCYVFCSVEGRPGGTLFGFPSATEATAFRNGAGDDLVFSRQSFSFMDVTP